MGVKSQAEGDKKRKKERKKEKRVSWRSAQVVGMRADCTNTESSRMRRDDGKLSREKERTDSRLDTGQIQTHISLLCVLCTKSVSRLQECSGYLNRIAAQFSAILVALLSRFLIIKVKLFSSNQ